MIKNLYNRGANLLDPENVYTTITNGKKIDASTKRLTDKEWSNGYKNFVACAYKAFCNAINLEINTDINFNKWSGTTRKLPWIPLDREVDELIAGCGRKVATFLQLLKETGARCGEAWNLEWTDLDFENSTLMINKTEKKGNPRQFKLSKRLVSMLNTLPKTSQRIFGNGLLKYFRETYNRQKRRMAHKLHNPRLTRITFHTLRHFYASMEYHKTKDILHVKERLGHKNINNTLIYTHLVNFDSDTFTVRVAKDVESATTLLEAGFEYVTDYGDEKLFRKRK